MREFQGDDVGQVLRLLARQAKVNMVVSDQVTGTVTMRYLALSTVADVETCEYPDSQKVLVVAGPRGQRGLRKMFRAENTVDYYDRERG